MCGIIGPFLFTFLLITAGLLRPGYSHITQFISELGAVGTPNAIVQQSNFVVSGLLSIAFAVGLYRGTRDGKAAKLGSVFVAVMGVGVVGAGIFSEDPNFTWHASLTNQMHSLASHTAFIAMIIAPLLIWRGSKNDNRWQPYRSYSAITGIVLLGLYLGTPFTSPWIGAYQRLYVGIFSLWIELLAIRLLKLSSSPSVSPSF